MCLPSLPDMYDLHNKPKTSLPSTDMLPITRWPFYAFLGGAMFYLLASSTCHLFSCHSERLSNIMLRLDYAGIASLISTSFYFSTTSCVALSFITFTSASSPFWQFQPSYSLFSPRFRSQNSELFGLSCFLVGGCLVFYQFCTKLSCTGTSLLHCTVLVTSY